MSAVILKGLKFAPAHPAARAAEPLLDIPDLTLGPGLTGITGANGAGKSTLLNLIAGRLLPTAGSVSVTGRVSVLAQAAGQGRVADLFGKGADYDALTAALAGDFGDPEAVDWTLEARIAAALSGVGLDGVAADRPLATLSGGQRMRAALAALTFDGPEILLLDEPTNDLDAEGRALVARLLAAHRGAALVASHDRALLAGMDRILELSEHGPRLHGGGWEAFAAARAAERTRTAAELEAAKRGLAAAGAKIARAATRKARSDRQGRAERAGGGQARVLLDAAKERAERSAAPAARLAARQREAAAARLEAAAATARRARVAAFDLPGPEVPSGRLLLRMEAVRHPRLAAPLDLTVAGPERIALTGPNGAGKSTLLRLAAGELLPEAGRIDRPGRAALLDQHVALLDPEESVLANFRRLNPEATENAARAWLARLLFRNTQALRPAAALSGGERLRAGLACVLGGENAPDLLLLDEPTNHLDLASVEAVEAALAGFRGALIVASHDAAFLAALAPAREVALHSQSAGSANSTELPAGSRT